MSQNHLCNSLCGNLPSQLLEPLELIIRTKLIPKLTGQSPPCDNLRHLLSLLARLGGIALTNPMSTAEAEFSASTKITDPLKKAVIEQSLELPHEITETQMRSRNEVCKLKRDQSKQDAERLKQSLPTSLQRSMDLAQEKGASTWFTTLPIREFGFNLHKGAFLDALALRYNWQPSRTPTTCACGRNFSVDHALSCPKGGFPSIRHNEIRDITANLLSEVCNDVRIEPDLQPINGEQLMGNVEDGARLDIAAMGSGADGLSARTLM